MRVHHAEEVESSIEKGFWTNVCSLKESPDVRKGHRLLYFPCLIQYGSEKSAVILLQPPHRAELYLFPSEHLAEIEMEKVNFIKINVGKPQA